MKDDNIYIEHMLDCIERILEYTQESREQFRNLQVMAESSQRLSSDEKLKHPDIPWREIAGFRNILVHDYLGLDLDVIWSVVEHDIPKLRDALKVSG
jgi:uncharacterized protein with HEPN domain